MKINITLKFSLLFFFYVVSFSLAKEAKAEIVEIQALSFGTVVVTSNSNVESFSIQKTGFINNTNGLRTMNDHQPGIFEITELVPNSFYNTTVDVTTPLMTSDVVSLESFTLTITDFDSRRQTSPQGVLQVRVGGTISTSGNGQLNFEPTNFSTQYNITISR